MNRAKGKRLLSWRGIAVVLGLALAAPAWAWEPPDSSTASEVLQGAREDREAGRLSEAAAKHLWFHEHALERDPAMSGVRLSFALHDWVELAKAYPPAKSDLLGMRDRAFSVVGEGGPQGHAALLEVLSIDHYLQDWRSSRDAFARLAARDPALADQLVSRALPALVAVQDYALASQHLRLDDFLPELQARHELMSRIPERSEEQRRATQRYRERALDIQLAQVVLVLVKTDRGGEAERVIAKARELLGPQARTHHLEAARQGVVPPMDVY